MVEGGLEFYLLNMKYVILFLIFPLLFSCDSTNVLEENLSTQYVGIWVTTMPNIGLDTMEIRLGEESNQVWFFVRPSNMGCDAIGEVSEDGLIGIGQDIQGTSFTCYEGQIIGENLRLQMLRNTFLYSRVN